MPDCYHGSVLKEQKRGDALLGYLKKSRERFLEHRASSQSVGQGNRRREDTRATMDTMGQFWSEPKYARFIDAEMVRYIFACAAQEVLNGNMSVAHHLTLLGNFLTTWIKIGKTTFLEAMRGNMPPEESPEMQTMEEFTMLMRKTETDQKVVLYLCKQIPCSCLNEDKKNAKQLPKTGRCSYCSSQDDKLELKKCSHCKSAQYCSKECQVADWKTRHKEDCEFLKQRREYERHKKQCN
jgi:hypothetical protein